MRMTIVRHAVARDKKSWPGSDLERPLDPIGERQAAGMARLLMKHKVRRIISSPAIRCVQTVQPLADATGVSIELWDASAATPMRRACSWPSPIPSIAMQCCAPTVKCSINCCWPTTCDGSPAAARLSTRRLLIKGSAWRLEITTSGRVSNLNHLRPIK